MGLAEKFVPRELGQPTLSATGFRLGLQRPGEQPRWALSGSEWNILLCALSIGASLEWLREEGYAAVVLVGPPDYYPRFGFLPASRYGLEWEMDVPDDVFQAVELSAGGLAGVRGIVRYRPEFAGV